ncbi:hypothetical protein ACRRTK_023443 [Alexandromys fortis]
MWIWEDKYHLLSYHRFHSSNPEWLFLFMLFIKSLFRSGKRYEDQGSACLHYPSDLECVFQLELTEELELNMSGYEDQGSACLHYPSDLECVFQLELTEELELNMSVPFAHQLTKLNIHDSNFSMAMLSDLLQYTANLSQIRVGQYSAPLQCYDDLGKSLYGDGTIIVVS